MIYTLISDSNFITESKSVGEEINSFNPSNEVIFDEKRDCRVLRQPLTLLPEEMKEFIEKTKNEKTRKERFLAYTTLLCGVKVFFDIDGCSVAKTPEGKPYLVSKANSVNNTEKYQKNEDLECEEYSHQKNQDFNVNDALDKTQKQNKPELHVSISHSEGVIAVCISDEGEVGVDIQREIPATKAQRLEKRFIDISNIASQELKVDYYYCNFSENEAKFEKIILSPANLADFTSKWAFSESVMKLYGRGFGDLKRLNELVALSQTEIKEYKTGANFAVATSIVKE